MPQGYHPNVAAPGDATAGPHGQALSDDFSTNKMGVHWDFYAGTDADRARIRYENGAAVRVSRAGLTARLGRGGWARSVNKGSSAPDPAGTSH